MGLFNFFGAPAKLITAQLLSNTNSYSAKRDSTTLAKMYETNGWVRSIFGRISDQVVKESFYLMDRGKKVEKHPLLDFLNQPNPFLTARQGWKIAQLHRDLVGESFRIITRGSNGTPTGWFPLPPHWVTEVAHFPGEFWTVSPDNSMPFEVRQEDIIWAKDANPFDPRDRGVSLTGAVKLHLDTDRAATEYLHNLLKNNARPDIIVSGTGNAPLNADERQRLENKLHEQFTGWKKAGKALVANNEIKVNTITASARDNQIVDISSHEGKRISRQIGVPPEVFGELENANRSTIDSASRLLAIFSTDPRLESERDVIASRVMPMFDLAGVELKYTNPIKEDRESITNTIKSVPWASSQAELREMLDLPHLEGSENVFMVPVNLTPVSNVQDMIKRHEENHEAGLKEEETPSGEDTPAGENGTAGKSLTKDLSVDSIQSVAASHKTDETIAKSTEVLTRGFEAVVSNQDGDGEFLSELKDWIIAAVAASIGFINETTEVRLLDAIEVVQSDTDLTEEKIAAVVSLALLGAGRATNVARTESTKIAGAIAQLIIDKSGNPNKTWIDMRDDDVRDTHRSLHRKTVPSHAKFTASDGDSAGQPGGFSKIENNAGCRCKIIPGEEEISEERAATVWREKEAERVTIERALLPFVKEMFAIQRDAIVASFKAQIGPVEGI